MKIAIIEDNEIEQNHLENLTIDYFLGEDLLSETHLFNSAEDFFASWPLDLDIILLDIQLGQLNGVEAAAKVRETDERVAIVFVTNNPQYSLAGYSVDALDYLIKPVTKDFLERVLAKAIRRLGNMDRNFLTIHNRDGYHVVHPKDVNYIEFINRKTILHTNTGSIVCIKTL